MQVGLGESFEILSWEVNARLFQEIDSLMTAMQMRTNRTNNSGINDRVLPKLQNIMGSLPLHQNGTGTGTPSFEQGSVMFGKTRIQNLQSRTEGPRVENTTLLLSW